MAGNVNQTTIANRALQLLGYQPIGSINDNDRGARAVNRAYYPILYSELRKNFWNFSIRRAILPASATIPLFGKANYFPLPADFLDLAMPDQTNVYSYGRTPTIPNTGFYTDYQIENMDPNTLAIASDMGAPLYIRYVSSALTESIFDSCFAEAFAAAIAMNICEELTQSNSKLQNAAKVYDDNMEMAKKRNAFEMKPVSPPIDRWTEVRR